jgi:hypothetical protein
MWVNYLLLQIRKYRPIASLYGSALLVLLSFAAVAEGANHYIRDGGSASTSGTGSCTSWVTANACDQLPSTLVRGDTYYVAGGTYPGRSFTTAESSTTLITIKGATVADHGTSTGWSDAYSVASSQAIFSDSLDFGVTGYWVLDGAVSPATPLTSGASSSANYGFRITDASACSNVREAISTTSNNTFRNFALISSCGEGTTSVCQFGVRLYSPPTSNITISHWYSENNIGDVQGPGGNTSNLLVEYHYSKGQWSDPSCHGEVYAVGGSSNVYRWSYYDQCKGTGCIASNGSDMMDYQIYGNVMNNVSNQPADLGEGGGNGAMAGASSIGYTDALVCNNTIIQQGMINWFYANVGSGNVLRNNIVKYNCSVSSGTTQDYNAWRSCYTGPPSESNAQTFGSDPWVGGGNWALSAATNAGNLTGCPAGNSVDMFGVTRGADGVVDRGAIEFVDGAPSAPSVTTTAASSVTTTTASSGGNVTSDGGDTVSARGLCRSTSANPTTSDTCTSDGTGTGSFTSSLTSLSPSTTYHIRAFATNSAGTSYGTDLTFTTEAAATGKSRSAGAARVSGSSRF